MLNSQAMLKFGGGLQDQQDFGGQLQNQQQSQQGPGGLGFWLGQNNGDGSGRQGMLNTSVNNDMADNSNNGNTNQALAAAAALMSQQLLQSMGNGGLLQQAGNRGEA